MDFFEVAQRFSQVSSIDELKHELDTISLKLSIEHYLFCLIHPTSFKKDSFTLIDNYPTEWMITYHENNLCEVDPIFHHCRNHLLPLNWEHIHQQKGLSKQSLTVMKEAALIGLRSGISIPLHGVGGESGVFSVADSSAYSCKRALELTTIMQSIAPFAHEAARRIRATQNLNASSLTKREKECLTWASDGKTAWEISEILGISERTANFHLINATSKVQAVNRQHAIAKALMQGLIIP